MFEIEGFVERHFGGYSSYGDPPSDIRVDCPFCYGRGAGDDNKAHLHISLSKQVVHCFRCGYKNSWVGMVMDVLDVPYWRALGEIYTAPKIKTRSIKEDVRSAILEAADEPQESADAELPEDYHLLTRDYSDHLTASAKGYLKRRGLGVDSWGKYKLGVADSVGYRVIIPIERGYWQGRAIYRWVEPRFLNPKSPARDILFNAQALETYDQIVICEGAFSAMAVGLNAVALIGKEPTKDKVGRLLDSGVKDFIITVEPGAYPVMSILADALHKGGCDVGFWLYIEGDPMDGEVYKRFKYDIKSRVTMSMMGHRKSK